MPQFTTQQIAAMKRIAARCEDFYQSYTRLCPPPNTVPVGGAHFDEWVKFVALREFLQTYRNTADADKAVEQAKQHVRETVATWNKSPRCCTINTRYEAQRWEGMGDGLIEWAEREVRCA